jgi:hypothetical protein
MATPFEPSEVLLPTDAGLSGAPIIPARKGLGLNYWEKRQQQKQLCLFSAIPSDAVREKNRNAEMANIFRRQYMDCGLRDVS